jgi:EAL domain-containing protein (putative c-di-GMP-specific phosphodiesterase class I)
MVKLSINELQSGRTYKNLTSLSPMIERIPFKLQVAVTETDISGREIAVAEQLNKISALKITIVLDEFSVGGINLTKLTLLPVNIVRFHQDFTHSVCSQKNSLLAAILKAVKQSHYQVICTGVTNIDSIKLLADMGCDYIQDLPIHLMEKNRREDSE